MQITKYGGDRKEFGHVTSQFKENLKYKFRDNCPRDIDQIYSLVYEELMAKDCLHSAKSQIHSKQKIVLRFFKEFPDLLISALNYLEPASQEEEYSNLVLNEAQIKSASKKP